MALHLRKLMLASAIVSLVACSGDDGETGPQGATGPQGPAGMDGTNGTNGVDGAPGQDAASSTISLSLLGRYETGEFDESAAEIVSFDPTTQQAFVVNANSGQIDVLDLSAPEAPTLVMSLDLAADIAAAVAAVASADDLGAANSVSVYGNTVAVAVEADTKQDNGYVAFYQTDGTFLSAVEVGALPDMLTFNKDGSKVVVANEGEPNGDYSVDPEGSVSIIDMTAGAGSLTNADVTAVSFADFNVGGSRAAEISDDVRISSKSASVAQDLEPEYVAISEDNTTAWVAMQENNALAVIDLSDNSIDTILGLSFKDHSILGNELDVSNRDDAIIIENWPVRGLYMPDTIDSYAFNGVNYIVTANEGDAREYLTDAADEADCTTQGGFDFDDGDCFHYLDEIRVKDIYETVDPTETAALASVFDLANVDRYAYGADIEEQLAALTSDEYLGRIKVVANMGVTGCTVDTFATTGQPSEGCVYENLYTYGARSFSIWNGETGERVFDSGNDFELITANRLGYDGFNSTNDENGSDDRSDDKGPEPEAIEIAKINGKTYGFIGLERVGGIMVYDITNPEAASFVQYISTRDYTVDIEALVDAGDFSAAGDLGPESILFVSAADSPNGEPLLIVGNEVSGTTAIFRVNEIITTATAP